MAPFVNRAQELEALASWWDRPESRLCVVWGRRRVGKTALLQEFSKHERVIFHTGAGRPRPDELRMLARATVSTVASPLRDLEARPFVDWDDAFETLAAAATEPLLVVLDEFPELVSSSPELAGVLRAFLDRAGTSTHLKVVLSGSAVRTMESMLEERAPLYGRTDLILQLHPFRPHEAALMLPKLRPADRALVWGLVGGVPLYLSWWNQDASVKENLSKLVATAGGQLLTEGQLVLATEGDSGDLGSMVLRAIAGGRTRHGEIADAVRAEPARTLDRLIDLRLIERLVPVTEDPRRSKRRVYRIADNFLAFWLGTVDRYRDQIERGLGRAVLTSLVAELDDHMGPRWEEAVRLHLSRLAVDGELGEDVVAIGPWWSTDSSVEIDAVVLNARERVATLVAEAKWARSVDARRIEAGLRVKAEALPQVRTPAGLIVAARDQVKGATRDTLTITARDVFS
ncbi:MAG: ATP-binding protein [Actinomycetota bacterium]